MKIKQMNINMVLEENWDDIKRPEDGNKFINQILVAARDDLQGEVVATLSMKIYVKGLPQNHQLALDQFLDGFYNPNKAILEENFAVASSIVHDRSFILYKHVGEKLCKVIG